MATYNETYMQEIASWIDAINSSKDIFSKEDLYKYLNRTNLTSDYQIDSHYVLIPITILYLTILVVGVVGNISTCIVIARNRSMHTATNYYLFSLAVSDLLLVISGIPFEVYKIWYPYDYIFGEAFCILHGFASEISANATVLTITAFTIERYIAICHPFLSHTMSKLSRAVKFIVAIWITALCLAVPQAIQFGVVADTLSTTCTVKYSIVEHAFEISGFVFFVGPMTVITVLYVLIGVKLRRSRILQIVRRASSSSEQNGDHRMHKNGGSQGRVIRMLVAVTVAFFLCWAPFHAQRMMAVYAVGMTDHSRTFIAIYQALTYVSGVLYFLSTCINPLLYNIMSNKFREAFKSTLADHCGLKKRSVGYRPNYSVLSRNGPSLRQSLYRSSKIEDANSTLADHCGLKKRSVGYRPNYSVLSRNGPSLRQSLYRSSKIEDANVSRNLERDKADVPLQSIFTTEYRNGFRPRCDSADSSQTTALTSISGEGNNNSKSNYSYLAKPNFIRLNRSVSETIMENEPLRNGSSNHATPNISERLRRSTKSIFKTGEDKFKSSQKQTKCGRPLFLTGNIDNGDASTISNSSLKELDRDEFLDCDLTNYMGDVNRDLM